MRRSIRFVRRNLPVLVFAIFAVVFVFEAYRISQRMQQVEAAIPVDTLETQRANTGLMQSLSYLSQRFNELIIGPDRRTKAQYELSLDIAIGTFESYVDVMPETLPRELAASIEELELVLDELGRHGGDLIELPLGEMRVLQSRLIDSVSHLSTAFVHTNEIVLVVLSEQVGQVAEIRGAVSLVLGLMLLATFVMALMLRQMLIAKRRAEKSALALQQSRLTLEHERNTLRTVLESLREGVVAYDVGMQLEIANSRFSALRGYPDALTAPGTPYSELADWDRQTGEFESDPEATAKLSWLTHGEIDEPRRFERFRPNGRVLEVVVSPVPGGGVVCTYSDITQRKEIERRTVEAKELAEAANERLVHLDRMKSMFIATMSHELRTPLNSIIGFTSVVLGGLAGEINDKQRDHLSRSKRAARHLLGLITDIIDISKIESGKIDVSPERFDLQALIADAVESVAEDAAGKGLALIVEPAPEIEIHCDRKRLYQVVLNLLSNAVKYSERGSIRVSTEDLGNDYALSVSDTGIGIPEQELPKVFAAFERISSPLSVQAGGTGLGLYLTRTMVQRILGGDISVESVAGQGSTFTMRGPKRCPESDRGVNLELDG